MTNPKGQLFNSAWTFGGTAAIKLLSSVILTRLLYPEAFGLITILFSIMFVIEMLADVGVFGLLVRHEKGDQRNFINTLWTIRLGRCCINGAVLFFAAPSIAGWYELPALETTLRIFSLWFVIAGLESMSLMLAIRRRNVVVRNYVSLASTLLSSCFVVAYSFFHKDHMGMVYGAMLDRVLVTGVSWLIYKTDRPRLGLDRAAALAVFHFAKYVMPSSLMTLVVVQFDKIVFLKLFSLELLGIYGLAGNIAGQLESLLSKVSNDILFPRCAQAYRNDPASFPEKYYSDNFKLHAFVLFLPAVMFGFAQTVIDLLYDDRYAIAGWILQLLAIRVLLATVAMTSHDALFAAGHVRIQFWGNIIRLVWFIPSTLAGYWLFGFAGFVSMAALEYLPTSIYYFYMQKRYSLMLGKYEALRLGFVVMSAVAAFLAAKVFEYAFHAIVS